MQKCDLIRLYMKPENRKLIHDWLSSDEVLDWLTSAVELADSMDIADESTIAAHTEAQELTVRVFEMLGTLFRLHNFDWHRQAGNHHYITCIKDVVANGEIFISSRRDLMIALPDFARAWNDADGLDEVFENLKRFLPAKKLDEWRDTVRNWRVVVASRALLCRELGFRVKRHVRFSGDASMGNHPYGTWEKK